MRSCAARELFIPVITYPMTHHYLVYIIASLLTCGLLAKTPNLIIILTDDQGYNDVGFNGCIDIPTPHLDQLAA
ncbi:MAG: hypothetical protein VXZ45_03460, partial [Verrucomicrobiota bacterium]|nr:hypothetical protein [Verrucomicrobiota bacterium]